MSEPSGKRGPFHSGAQCPTVNLVRTPIQVVPGTTDCRLRLGGEHEKESQSSFPVSIRHGKGDERESSI